MWMNHACHIWYHVWLREETGFWLPWIQHTQLKGRTCIGWKRKTQLFQGENRIHGKMVLFPACRGPLVWFVHFCIFSQPELVGIMWTCSLGTTVNSYDGLMYFHHNQFKWFTILPPSGRHGKMRQGNTWIQVIPTRQQNWHSKHVTFSTIFCFHPYSVSPDRFAQSHVSPHFSSAWCRGVHHSV